MSEVHIYLIRFGGQPQHPSFLILFFVPLSSFLLPRRSMLFLTGDLTQWHLPVGMKDLNLRKTEVTGAVDKIVLPDGMQSVNFYGCTSLTGDLTPGHHPHRTLAPILTV